MLIPRFLLRAEVQDSAWASLGVLRMAKPRAKASEISSLGYGLESTAKTARLSPGLKAKKKKKKPCLTLLAKATLTS